VNVSELALAIYAALICLVLAGWRRAASGLWRGIAALGAVLVATEGVRLAQLKWLARVPVTLENARAQFKDGHDVVLEAAVALMK
jgi:hypothetical protein